MAIAPLYREAPYYRWPKDVASLRFFWNVLVPSEPTQAWHAVACKVMGVVLCLGFSFVWVPVWLLAISLGNLHVCVKNSSFRKINERFFTALNEQSELLLKNRDEEWTRTILERNKAIGFRSLRKGTLLFCMMLMGNGVLNYLNRSIKV
jgi:hypothetical protein